MNKIGNYIKEERKKAGLTQEEFAMRSGLGLRFVRELEQGKETVRMDKVNQALAMFGKEAVPGEKEEFWFPLAAGTIGGLIMSVSECFFSVLTLKKKHCFTSSKAML